MEKTRPTDFESAISSGRALLAEGSMYDLLLRKAGDSFDPDLAHLGLIYSESGRSVLSSVYLEYIRAAEQAGFPMIVFTPTWRANQERVARSLLAHQQVNSDAVEFLCDLRQNTKGCQLFIGGLIGCRNDCYDASQALDSAESESFHSVQIEELASTSVDFLFASTLPSVQEAMGIARAMSRTMLPYVLSFVVDSTGTVMDGTPIAEAFQQIDGSVSRKPSGYFINCIHPEIFLDGVPRDGETRCTIADRLIGFQGNTARCDPRQFESLKKLESEDPQTYARSVLRLKREFNVQVLGGCCGTNPEHIRAIGELLKTI